MKKHLAPTSPSSDFIDWEIDFIVLDRRGEVRVRVRAPLVVKNNRALCCFQFLQFPCLSSRKYFIVSSIDRAIRVRRFPTTLPMFSRPQISTFHNIAFTDFHPALVTRAALHLDDT